MSSATPRRGAVRAAVEDTGEIDHRNISNREVLKKILTWQNNELNAGTPRQSTLQASVDEVTGGAESDDELAKLLRAALLIMGAVDRAVLEKDGILPPSANDNSRGP